TRSSARLLASYSRQDEFDADYVAAKLVGAASMRSALIQLEAVQEKLRRLPWTERVAQLELEDSFSRWLTSELGRSRTQPGANDHDPVHDPYASHPSLSDRIAALPPDDGLPCSQSPAIDLLANPDAVAPKVIAEIHRFAALEEQKDTKALARWARKTQRGAQIGLLKGTALFLIVLGLFFGFAVFLDGHELIAALFLGATAAPGALIWRWETRRDRVTIPVPSFSVIKAAMQTGRLADLGEKENQIESELR